MVVVMREKTDVVPYFFLGRLFSATKSGIFSKIGGQGLVTRLVGAYSCLANALPA